MRDGARRVRAQYATPLLTRLREAVGLRDLSRSVATGGAKKDKAALPAFKQYREQDGLFYFKFVDGERVLLQSVGFASPREAGQLIAQFRQPGAPITHEVSAVHLGKRCVGHLHGDTEATDLTEALARLAEG